MIFLILNFHFFLPNWVQVRAIFNGIAYLFLFVSFLAFLFLPEAFTGNAVCNAIEQIFLASLASLTASTGSRCDAKNQSDTRRHTHSNYGDLFLTIFVLIVALVDPCFAVRVSHTRITAFCSAFGVSG